MIIYESLKKLSHFLFVSKSRCPPLSDLDDIYKTAISQLPACARREYCERLISRTVYEVRKAKCREEIKKLKQLAGAAKKEAIKLDINNS